MEAGDDGVVFSVSGHGTTTIGSSQSNGGLIVQSGGASVNAGGLTVAELGITIDTGSLFVADTQRDSNTVSIVNRNASFGAEAVSVDVAAAADPGWFVMRTAADAGATPLVDIRGDGGLIIHQGGANVTGLATLHSGLDVSAGGIDVVAGGLVVQDGGARISHDGSGPVLTITSNATSHASDLLLIETPLLLVPDPSFNLVRVDGPNETAFSIAADGTTFVARDMTIGTNRSDLIYLAGSIAGRTAFSLEGDDTSDNWRIDVNVATLTEPRSVIFPDASGTILIIEGDLPSGRVAYYLDGRLFSNPNFTYDGNDAFFFSNNTFEIHTNEDGTVIVQGGLSTQILTADVEDSPGGLIEIRGGSSTVDDGGSIVMQGGASTDASSTGGSIDIVSGASSDSLTSG